MPMGRMQKIVKIDMTMSQELWPYSVMNEIQKVMEEGLEKHPDGEGWEETAPEHVARAIKHLWSYKRKLVATNPMYGGMEDHLTHAFTRLMMAVAIERGYVDKKGDAPDA